MSYTVYDPIQTSLDPDLFAPLAGGTVYFGVPNGNPQAVVGDRVQVYLARQGLADLAISQPVSIGPGGHWYYNGNPAQIKILVPYCVQAFNSLGVQEYYAPSAGDEVSKFNSIDAELAVAVKSVDTYADFASTSATIGQVVVLYEHTSGGKVGGGNFMVASSSGVTPDTGWAAVNGSIAFLRMQTEVYIEDFGAIPGAIGAAIGAIPDSTAAIQACFDYAKADTGKNKIVKSRGGLFKITGPLTAYVGGIDFGVAGYGLPGGPDSTIIVDGTGFTGITITGTPTIVNISVGASGQTANGILIQSPLAGRFGKVRAYNFDGFGVKCNRMWDCVFDTISVERCGNASEYAFSINDDGDTSNMTHICRLQVERATTKAIFVSANTLSCVIDNIHSEQAIATAGVNTWVLGGNRCTYNTFRLEANAPSSNATALLTGANSTYICGLVENSAVVKLESSAAGSITLISPEFQGATSNVAGQVGKINLVGGAITTLTCEPLGFIVNGTKITTLTINSASFDPTKGVFNDCEIGSLVSGAADSACTFNGGTIGTHNNLLAGVTVLRGVTVNNGGAATLALGFRTLKAYYSTINAAVSIDNGGIISCGTVFSSTIAQTAGPIISLFDDASYAGGAVTGLGAPTGGTWPVGARTKNMAAAVGQPKAWVCSAAGTPGTWTSEGNL